MFIVCFSLFHDLPLWGINVLITFVLILQVAIDSGDGQHFYAHPSSMNNNITNLAQTSNVNINGRWMFRLDDTFVRLPNCFNDNGLCASTNQVFHEYRLVCVLGVHA